MKAEDIAKLSDDDIGRYFAGSFGPGKRRDAIALLRWLASKQAASRPTVPDVPTPLGTSFPP